MKKILLTLLALLVLSIVTFYFWGSSNFSDDDKYDQIVNYNNELKSSSDTLSILTYNIGYLSGMTNNLAVDRKQSLFTDNFDRSVRILDSANYDFIGLQEVDFFSSRSYNINQFDSLGNYLNYYQGAYAVNWDKSYVPFPYLPVRNHFGKMLSGQGILSKMQILSNEFITLRKPISAPFYYNAFYLDRLLQITKVQVGSDTLIIMNVHLEAFDKETRELQAKKVYNIYKSYSSDYPTLLIGDFNSRPPFASDIVEEEITIGLFLIDPNIGEAIEKDRYLESEAKYFTFNTDKPYERLDYIFYNKNKISKIDSDVLRVAGDISDHLPVWMTFSLK
ncbi:endonuclease/exonuclease/phosphatase family protein [Marivirga arenosa]|uniref:Endonuclease/exonuclease/phosphatase family protein n=1 Tax=Marivirga arenosa TaxID=3059076 RepID=A0AA51RD34_9BACT|nr:endonuclease/exonuclease/phosphatase family protein [Marivirga sp. ABR2-2]WMN06575.1 endonuclease/exonuclease/phosphatase family protein [Marivirga sp. ABR2-2]